MEEGEEEETQLDYLNFVETEAPIDSCKVRVETRGHPILGIIFNYIRYGFPKHTDNVLLKPFFCRQEELTIDNGIILWGYRVVIPTVLREQL